MHAGYATHNSPPPHLTQNHGPLFSFCVSRCTSGVTCYSNVGELPPELLTNAKHFRLSTYFWPKAFTFVLCNSCQFCNTAYKYALIKHVATPSAFNI